MTPYKLTDKIIIDLDHLADASWQSEVGKIAPDPAYRWLHVRLAAPTDRMPPGPISHILMGEDADRFWQHLLSHTPEAAESALLVRLVQAYGILAENAGVDLDAHNDITGCLTIRLSDMERIKQLLDEAKADLEQRSK